MNELKSENDESLKDIYWKECLTKASNFQANFTFKVYERSTSQVDEYVSKQNLREAIELLKQFDTGVLLIETYNWSAGGKVGFLEHQYYNQTFSDETIESTEKIIVDDIVKKIAQILFREKYPNG